MATALLFALSLLATDATSAPSGRGEPLPAGAPTDEYELTGWCYGALAEYLDIYDRVKPDLIEIDKAWGTTVKETEPYTSDIAAARAELKVLAAALEAAEKASPRPIAPQGAAAIKRGQGIWQMVENHPHRELARAWLTWGVPDQCGLTARALTAKSDLLGKALTYNTKPDETRPMAPPTTEGLILKPIAPVTRSGSKPTPSPVLPPPDVGPPTAAAPPAAAAASPPPALEPSDVASAPPQRSLVGQAPPPSPPQEPLPAPPQPAPVTTAAPTAAPSRAMQPSDESLEPIL